eukprot:m.136785 g.136785  ORF g.136785 m.136785 type:complete len:118 (-) comp14892_c1_seq2:205-558(-)
MMAGNFPLTHSAAEGLRCTLLCPLCEQVLKDPVSISQCNHTFCRDCVEAAVAENASCPMCQQPAWHKDLNKSHEVESIVQCLHDLDKFLGSPVLGLDRVLAAVRSSLLARILTCLCI